MSIVLLLARLLLAGVFIVAGLTKLADLKGSRQAMRDFGVPTFLAASFGVLLPLAELAIGIALLPTLSAWWAAIGALALLLLFVVGISYNLARGRQPDCHCFGQLYSRPIGWPTLIRNLLLAAVAGFIVGFGWSNTGVDFFALLGSLALAQRIELVVGVILVALVAIEGWVLLQVLRQQGRLLLRMEALEARLASNGSAVPAAPPVAETPAAPGLPVGSPASAFALSGLYGETLTLEALRARGKPVVLVFSDPGCGPCNALIPEMGRWQREYADKLTFVLISRGSVEDNRAKISEHSIMHVLLQKDREIAETYQIVGTPSAVLVRPDGMIGSSLAQGADEIRGMVAGAVGIPVLRSLPVPALQAPSNGNGNGNGAALPVIVAQPGQPAVPKMGEQAPDFSLPDVTGKTIRLSNYRGSKMLLLFWDPGCGFCQQMLDDLKAWEAQPPKGAPKLLVVSSGNAETNSALGLRSRVLLDQSGMSVGSKFGANGTPMAVLVDARGRIASELAAGAPQVLALAGAANVADAASS
jgi:peroxiredoxin